MPSNDTYKSARQMIDDLINDDPEQAKQSFHDFLKAKTISKLNPEMEEASEIDDIQMGDDGESVTDDSNPENREDMQFTDYDPESEDSDLDDNADSDEE